MDLHRGNASKIYVCWSHLLHLNAYANGNFAVDPDQTVSNRAVRFGFTLFATKASYRQTNVANLVQAVPRRVV